MNLGELRTQMRNRLDDTAGKRLWSDAELDSLINEAYFEAVERARLIEDEARVTTRAGKDTYRVTGALRITRVIMVGDRYPLGLRDVFDLDRERPGWQSRDPGAPEVAIIDEDTFRLAPVPAAAGAALVTIKRLPRELLSGDTAEPEIAPRYHLRMLDWAFHLAYDKRDADAQDAQKSATYAARFTESFGERLTAKQQRMRSDARRHVTRSSW